MDNQYQMEKLKALREAMDADALREATANENHMQRIEEPEYEGNRRERRRARALARKRLAA